MDTDVVEFLEDELVYFRLCEAVLGYLEQVILLYSTTTRGPRVKVR